MKRRFLVFLDYLYLLQYIAMHYLGYVVNSPFTIAKQHASSYDSRSLERKTLVSLVYLCLFICKTLASRELEVLTVDSLEWIDLSEFYVQYFSEGVLVRI